MRMCVHLKCKYQECQCGDVPGGPVVKNPPSDEGNVGSIPGQGIPRAVGQLSLWTVTG